MTAYSIEKCALFAYQVNKHANGLWATIDFYTYNRVLHDKFMHCYFCTTLILQKGGLPLRYRWAKAPISNACSLINFKADSVTKAWSKYNTENSYNCNLEIISKCIFLWIRVKRNTCICNVLNSDSHNCSSDWNDHKHFWWSYLSDISRIIILANAKSFWHEHSLTYGGWVSCLIYQSTYLCRN